jgi:hypothetical protein
MQPRVFEFVELNKALNYYQALFKAIEKSSLRYNHMWFEVALQYSNTHKVHIVTLNFGFYDS